MGEHQEDTAGRLITVSQKIGAGGEWNFGAGEAKASPPAPQIFRGESLFKKAVNIESGSFEFAAVGKNAAHLVSRLALHSRKISMKDLNYE